MKYLKILKAGLIKIVVMKLIRFYTIVSYFGFNRNYQ